jgi:hypothetical protein
MEMKLDFVLNQISFKFFVKMIRIKGFRNPKNYILITIQIKIAAHPLY